MIRVSKDLNNIPNSLIEKKTETRRNTCIRDRKYHQDKKFDTRFKQRDTKDKLKQIYNQKCVFCEQKVIECTDNNLEDCSSTIEHYRPKSVYYWLAFSWDNILWCCHRCNQNKKNNFEVLNASIEYEKTFKENVHASSSIYNSIENPKMIHLEFESVIKELSFYKGVIASNDMRVKYTIRTCGIDRDDLNEERKKVIDTFLKQIKAKKLLNEPIGDIVEALKMDIRDKEKEFIALRFWLLRNYKFLET